MEIRKGTIDDLEAVAVVEARCFPPEQAATREQALILERLFAAIAGQPDIVYCTNSEAFRHM